MDARSRQKLYRVAELQAKATNEKERVEAALAKFQVETRFYKDVGSGGLFTGYPRLRAGAAAVIGYNFDQKKLIDIGFCGGFHRILKIILDGF